DLREIAHHRTRESLQASAHLRAFRHESRRVNCRVRGQPHCLESSRELDAYLTSSDITDAHEKCLTLACIAFEIRVLVNELTIPRLANRPIVVEDVGRPMPLSHQRLVAYSRLRPRSDD